MPGVRGRGPFAPPSLKSTVKDKNVSTILTPIVGIQNYDSVDKVLHQQEMTQQKDKKYLNKIINDAKIRRNQ